MIKNKAIIEELRQRKEVISCENCRYCNLQEYHSGKYYCTKLSVFQNAPINLDCFERRDKLHR